MTELSPSPEALRYVATSGIWERIWNETCDIHTLARAFDTFAAAALGKTPATPAALCNEIKAAVMSLICWFPIASRTRQSAAAEIAKAAAGFAAAAVEREREKWETGDTDPGLEASIKRFQERCAILVAHARAAAIEECAKELDAEAIGFEADFESEIFEQAAAHVRALASSPPRQSNEHSYIIDQARYWLSRIDTRDPDLRRLLEEHNLFAVGASWWRPIETAPHEMRVLVCSDTLNARGAEFRDGIWLDDFIEEIEPTHWQPIPAPPGRESEGRWTMPPMVLSAEERAASVVKGFCGYTPGERWAPLVSAIAVALNGARDDGFSAALALLAEPSEVLRWVVAEAIAEAGTSHFGDDTPLRQQENMRQVMRLQEARAALRAAAVKLGEGEG